MKIVLTNESINATIENFSYLMQENISIGVKNMIQKILHKLKPHQSQFNQLHKELLLEFGAKWNGDPNKSDSVLMLPEPLSEDFIKKFDELKSVSFNEEFDLIDFKFIENIHTEKVYDLILLKPFFENI